MNNKNIRTLLLGAAAVLFGATSLNAQALQPEANPGVGYYGPVVLRTEFVSYDIREQSEKGDLAKNQYYLPLEFSGVMSRSSECYSQQVDIPYAWLDRQLFIQIEGMQGYYLYVNGRKVAYGEDSRTPVQFDISAFVTDGANTIEVEPVGATGARLDYTGAPQPEFKAFLFSQPKIRIEDFEIVFEPDSTGGHGIFDLKIALANSYNYRETVTVGYDIYSPQGKLLYYDFKDIALDGQARDTLSFSEHVWRANDNFWSAAKSGLHYGQLSVKRGARMVEYIPFRVGYGRTELVDGKILRNGKAIEIKAAQYNAAASRKETATRVAALKKEGVNTLCPDYPQPMWFYEVCDELGMYVIDRANIHSTHRVDDRRVGGALSNDPQWLGAFETRTAAAFERTKNNSCVIARSLGGDVGNGFNMYRSYQLLKRLDPQGAVVYNDARGEWNTDLEPIEAK